MSETTFKRNEINTIVKGLHPIIEDRAYKTVQTYRNLARADILAGEYDNIEAVKKINKSFYDILPLIETSALFVATILKAPELKEVFRLDVAYDSKLQSCTPAYKVLRDTLDREENMKDKTTIVVFNTIMDNIRKAVDESCKAAKHYEAYADYGIASYVSCYDYDSNFISASSLCGLIENKISAQLACTPTGVESFEQLQDRLLADVDPAEYLTIDDDCNE